MTKSKSAEYYANNPEAAEKKRKYQAKRNKDPKQVAYRVELKRARRQRNLYGKGGPDMSHTESGKLVAEDPSTNRARNGSDGKSTKRADSSVGITPARLRWDKKCGKSGIPANAKCTKPTSISPDKLKVLRNTAIVATAIGLGVGIWSKTSQRKYDEANVLKLPWKNYEKTQELVKSSPEDQASKSAYREVDRELCGRRDAEPSPRARFQERLDVWMKSCNTIGDESHYGRVILHPNREDIFKVVRETKRDPQGNIDPITREVFKNEAGQLAYANRIGVPSPKLKGFNEKLSVIHMEFLDKHKSIRQHIEGHIAGKIPTNQFVKIYQELRPNVLAATYKMHSKGMIHGDLHTGNIMFNPIDRKVKIIDFGSSKTMDRPLQGEDLDRLRVYVQVKMARELAIVLPKTLGLPDPAKLKLEKATKSEINQLVKGTNSIQDVTDLTSVIYGEYSDLLSQMALGRI